MVQPFLPIACGPWVHLKDGDDSVRAIFDHHYSRRRYRDGRRRPLFVGPGHKVVLMTPEASAIFVWRKFRDKCVDARTGRPQAGVNCAVFRREPGGGASIGAHPGRRGRRVVAVARRAALHVRRPEGDPQYQPRFLLPRRGLAAVRVDGRREARPRETALA